MRGLLFIFSTLTLLSTTISAQKASLFGGTGVVIPNQSGVVTDANNVFIQALPDNGSFGSDPDISISLGLNYEFNKFWKSKVYFQYVSLFAAFAAVDEDQRDPVLGTITKVNGVSNPVLTPSFTVIRQLICYGELRLNLMTGLNWQLKLPANNPDLSFRRPEDQRLAITLSQTDDAIKNSMLLYSYGVEIEFKKLSVMAFNQRSFSRSFTSTIDLEGSSFDLISKRHFFQLQLNYSFLKLKSKKN